MAHPNEEALRRADEALARGDVQAMMDLFADDAVIHVGGRSKLAGDYKGKDQLLEMYGRFIQSLGNIEEMSTHDILANDTHGIQLQSVTAERDGQRITIKSFGAMHFADGKVTEAWFLDEDPYAADPWFDAGLK
jgi:ketosteroid isomerase-like protein